MKNYNQLTYKIIAFALLSFFSQFPSQIHAALITSANNAEWEFTEKAKVIKYLLSTVIWPKEAIKDDTLHVCIVGSIAASKPINDLNGIVINKFKIKVGKTTLKQALNNCQLVYIAMSEKDNTKQILTKFSGKPVLLISDIPNFADSGGSMNFIETKGIIAITVNVESIKNSNLTFDMAAFSHITVIPKQSDLEDTDKPSKNSQ